MSRRRRQVTRFPSVSRRTTAVRTLQAGLVIALVAPLSTAGAPAAVAAPQKVLQSVAVTLGTDGSITAIDSTSVAQTGDDDPTTDERALDPTENAGGLPVRVLTTWRLGDRSGTDLADIAGEAGRVVVEVTVQNTTVRPQAVSYDAGGTRREQYALVGAPLTVIASAGLGGSLATVVTENSATPAEVTNGLLSVSETGATQVQWSALLAPPRLAPSVTFRLVQDTQDFTPPTIDLSVQPGLVTDTSIEGLLDAAFSDDRDSTLQMESRTIDLVGDVNAVLTEAGTVLERIESQLDGSADRLGTRALADLEASSSHVTSSLTGLTGDLDSLSGQMESAMTDGNSAVLEGLLDTLDGVKDLLGDPRAATAPDLGSVDGCAVPDIDVEDTSTSVYEQLLLVGAQLGTLRSASTDCSAVITGALRASVGTSSDTCTPGSHSAVCAIDEARDELGDQATALAGLQADLIGDLDQEGVTQLGTDLTTLREQLGSIQDTAYDLAHPEEDDEDDGDGEDVNPLAALTAALVGLRTQLVTLQGSLNGLSVTDLTSALGDIKEIADGQVTALGATDQPASLLGKAKAAADLVATACAVPGYDPASVSPELSTYLSATSQGCTDAGARAGEVLGGLQSMLTTWNTVLGKTDVGADVEAIEDAISGMALDVQTIVTAITTMLSGSVLGLTQGLEDLSDSLEGLYDAGRVPTGCVGGAPSNSPLNVALRSYQRVSCNVSSLAEQIGERFDDVNETLVEGQGDLGDGITATDQARVEAEENIGLLTTQLGESMKTVSRKLRTEGKRKIQARRAGLDAQFAAFGTTLQGRTKSALDRIAATVGASNRSLLDSERQLTGDISKVIVDLGSNTENGTGLLGVIQNGAGQTGLANQQIGAANEKTAAFAAQRTQGLEQIYLQQAQVSAALERLTSFPALGLDLPGGSQALTVYSFHLGGN